MKFLIAYDIADPKRLRQVASYLEQVAQRVQKSIFLFEGTPSALRGIQHSLLGLIDMHEDRVQSWPTLETTDLHRWDAGTALPAQAICIVVSPEETLILEDRLV